jgi:hypothetical protein
MTGSFDQSRVGATNGDDATKTKRPALGGPFCVCMVAAFVYTPAHPWLRVLLLALLFRPMAAALTAEAAMLERWLAAKAFMARLQHMTGSRASCQDFDYFPKGNCPPTFTQA